MRLNIFIVEDSAIFAATLTRMLITMGHQVAGVLPSFEEAVVYLKTIEPDLVITDIMLSGEGTGIDVARYINEHVRVPVIFQSSVTDTEIIKQAFDCNPVAFLKKPVLKEALLLALSDISPVGQ